MKKMLLLSLILTFTCTTLFSQSGTENEKKQALLFGLNGLALNTIDGGFGKKEWRSPTVANTFKMNLLYSKDRKGGSDQHNGAENNEIALEALFGVEKHYKKREKLSPYWGVEVGIGLSQTVTKTISGKAFSYIWFYESNESEIKVKMATASIHFLTGLEYWLTEQVSLAGHYRIGGLYGYGIEETLASSIKDEQKITKIDVGTQTSMLTLAVYF